MHDAVQPDATTVTDPMLGTTLAGRYQVSRCIGRGGMGIVYEAVHVALGKRVAIKLLLDKYADDREAVERFHREALTATQIGDDHIIDVVDVGTTPEGKSFVVLELLDGHDLGKVLAASGPLPASRAVHIIQQVLRGLGAAHAKGIVHRDMKPDNVFIVPHSETPDFVKILDFGISKIMAAQDAKVRLTATGTVVGTPIYMAPEQALGNQVDHRADLYSVGVMLYELLAGRPPFVAESYLALVTQHLQAVPPDLGEKRPDLPRALINAVHRALSKEPDQRYRNAEEFARSLPSPAQLRNAEAMGVTFGSGMMGAAGTPGMRPVAAVMGPTTARGLAPAEVRSRRRWILGAVLALAAIAAVVVAIVVATRGPAGEVSPGLATLEVETSPPGVKVYLDDEYVGATPLQLTDVAVGKHRVRLEREGYVSMSTSKSVRTGESATMMVVLNPTGAAAAAAPTPAPPTPTPAVAAPIPAPASSGGSSKHKPPKHEPKIGTHPVNPYTGGDDPPNTDPPKVDPPKVDPPKKGDRTKPNPYGD